MPSTTSYYQLVDVTDPEFKNIIYSPEYRKSVPSKQSGFYYRCVINRIRTSVRLKHISLLEKGTADSMPDVEDGLIEAVGREKEKEAQGIEEDEGLDEESEDTNMTDTVDAVKKAMEAIDTPDKGKRLKDVVDDYMNELVKSDRNGNL